MKCLNCNEPAHKDFPFCSLECAANRYAIVVQVFDIVEGQLNRLIVDVQRLIALV